MIVARITPQGAIGVRERERRIPDVSKNDGGRIPHAPSIAAGR